MCSTLHYTTHNCNCGCHVLTLSCYSISHQALVNDDILDCDGRRKYGHGDSLLVNREVLGRWRDEISGNEFKRIARSPRWIDCVRRRIVLEWMGEGEGGWRTQMIRTIYWEECSMSTLVQYQASLRFWFFFLGILPRKHTNNHSTNYRTWNFWHHCYECNSPYTMSDISEIVLSKGTLFLKSHFG